MFQDKFKSDIDVFFHFWKTEVYSGDRYSLANKLLFFAPFALEKKVFNCNSNVSVTVRERLILKI